MTLKWRWRHKKKCLQCGEMKEKKSLTFLQRFQFLTDFLIYIHTFTVATELTHTQRAKKKQQQQPRDREREKNTHVAFTIKCNGKMK